ncbi:MAG: RHS repeat-associated core domain-containing protein [Baekduia sp.]
MRPRSRGARPTLTWGKTRLRFTHALPRGRWTRVAVTWDASSVRLFLDGHAVERDAFGAPDLGGAWHALSFGTAAGVDLRGAALVDAAHAPPLPGIAKPTASARSRAVAVAAAVPGNTALPTISGTAKDAQTLTATNGTWSGSPTSYAKQWQRCDSAGANCTNISGATAATYVLTSADVGSKIKVKVTATNASGSASVTSAATAVVIAAAPVSTAVPTISGTAKDGQTLTSTTGTWTGTTPLTYGRQWRRCDAAGANCVDISGATATTYVVAAADVGKTLRVVLTATNAAGSASATSAQTAVATAAAPANTAAPLISGTLKEGAALSATPGTWTGTPTITYAYAWQRCTAAGASCAAISGATSATYRLVAADVTKTVRVAVTATNAASSVTANSAVSAVITTGPPVVTTAPAITGTAKDGETLTSSTGTWAGTGTPTYARQWKRCDVGGAGCTAISGATGATYVLTGADVAATIRVTVTATNGIGATSADAAQTAAVQALAPANTATPAISGTAREGQTLTVSNGTWTGSPTISYTYQWRRCAADGTGCSDLGSATAATYTVVVGDVGHALRAVVTATNSGGSATATAAATSAIQAAAPIAGDLPVISGDAIDGTTLTGTDGTWTAGIPTSFAYRWKRCNSDGSACANIAGATAATYAVTADDLATTLRFAVTATNDGGSATATSDPTAIVAPRAPINATAPTITGYERLGMILTVHDGTWTGSPNIAYTHQWRRCDKAGNSCVDIAQAINGSYRLADADVSSTLRVVVTATNGAGATSAATAATDIVGTGETSSEAPDTATRYDYDAAGRLKTMIGRDSAAAPGDPLQAAIYHWDAVGNLLSVDRRATATPQIDELDPDHGTVSRKVTITGTGFSKRISQDTVRFNGTEATILDASPTKLVVRVPSGATDGAVSATAPGGSTTSPEPFTVTSSLAPHIDTISPNVTASPIGAGEEVTITGSHFAEHLTDNIVMVNGHRAELVSLSSGTLKIKAPPGAMGGRVVVTTPEGTDTGPDLYISPVGSGTGNVVQTQRVALDEANTITSNAADKMALAVFEGHVDQEISIDATSASGYAFLQVYSPNGAKIGEFGVGEGWGNWMDAIHLPEDGTYTLVYQPTYYSSGGGHASVIVHDVGNAYAEAQPTAAGTDVDLSSSVAGTNPGVRMDLQVGQEISVVGSDSTFGYSNFRWIAPDGTELVASNGFGVGGAWFDSVRIPTSGRWTLRVDPQGNYTGHVHLKLYDASELGASVTPDADGDIAHATTTVPGQNVRFTFTGHAGQRISFKGTDDSTVGTAYGNATVTLLSPSGSHLQDSPDLHAFSTPTQLPADGTYSILVDPRAPQFGLIGLKVWDVPNDLDQDVTPSATGDTKTIELPAAGQIAHFRVNAPAGQKVSIKASDSTFDQVSLKWYRPDGSFLGSSQYLSTGGTWFGGTKLDPAGTYDLRVGPENGSTGSIKLTFYDATDATPVSVTPTVTGAPFALNVAVPGQTATATFTGHVGQRIGMHSISTGFGRGFGFGAIYAPDGSNVGTVGIGNETYTDRMTLTQNGTYTITAQGMWEDTGLTQMVIYDVPADQTATVTPTLAGVSTHFDISPFQDVLMHVDGHAGQKISAQVDQEATYINAYWVNATGSRFGPNAWFTPPGGFQDQVTLPADGDVTAVIDPWAWTGGSTTVKLYDAQDLVRDLGDGGTVHLDLATPGRNALVTFDGHAGDVVAFDFPNSTIPHWTAALYGPSGSQISFGWGASTTNTLPADGQYTFVIDPWWGETGSVDAIVTPSGGSSARVTAHTTKASHVKAGSPKGSFRTLKQYLHGTSTSRLLRTGGTAPARTALPKEAKAPATLAEALGERSMPEHAAGVGAGQPASAKKHQRSPLSARLRRPSGVPEAWRPKRTDRAPGGWVTGRQPSPWATLAALQGRLGMTSVAGQALKLDGAPLKGVRVSIVGAEPVTTTDETGRFLLEGVPAGKHTLRVEGSTASKGGRRYGDYELVMTLKANETTALDDTLWMTRLDAAGDRKITSPTAAIRMTNPKIPGFEVRIPAGSRVTDRQGRTLHRLNLSAVPLDRPPFALPTGVTVSAYFTVQPGGAYFSKGAQIVYPNYHHLRPRSRVTFWDYDAKDRGWFEYGKGRVTANGKQIVPDKGVRVWKLSGAMAATNPGAPPEGPEGRDPKVGDPVDPHTGLLLYHKTDLSIGGSMPFNLTRTYRQDDPYAYELGAGFTTVLDTRMVFTAGTTAQIQLVLSGGGTVTFDQTGGGSDPYTSTYESKRNGDWDGATIKYQPSRSLWLLTKPDGSAMEFGQGGPVTAFITKTGLRTTITRGYRNIVNSLQQVNFPDGRWLRFDGNEMWDNAGRHVHYTFDYFRRLTQVEDAEGHTTTYAYDGNTDDLTSITDARGVKILQNEYHSGYVYKQTMASGGTYTFHYQCWPDLSSRFIIHSMGRAPGSSRPAPIARAADAGDDEPSGPCGDPGVMSSEITHPNGTIEKISWRADGHGWTRSFNSHPGPGDTAVKGESLTIDDAGRPTERETGSHNVKYSYNAQGDLDGVTTAIDDEHDATVHFGYDSAHNLVDVTDPLGKVTHVTRDARRRITSITDPTQRVTRFTYSGEEERPATITQPGGQITRMSYHAGDLASVTDPLGHTTSYYNDAAGRPTRITDALGHTSRRTYTPNGQLKESTDPKGRTTTFDYDANGKVTAVTDARGNAIHATYDAMEELATYEDADGAVEHFVRNGFNQLTSATDRRGVRTVFRYDSLGRQTFAGFGAHDSDTAFASTLNYHWNSSDQVTSMVDSEAGTTNLTYDRRDLPTQITSPDSDVSYQYDAAGHRTTMQVGPSTTTTYAYDDAGRPTGLARGGVSAAFTLDANGRRTGATLPGGIAQADTLDDAGRLTSRHYTPAVGTPKTVDYAYDAANHRIATWGDLDVAHLPQAVASSTYDEANRLTSRGTVEPTYDAAGNLTNDGQRAFTWNSRAQLSKVTQGGNETDYAYDALGRRRSTTAGGTTTQFVYDGWNVVQQSISGGATTDVLAGLSLDEVFANTTGGQTQTTLDDALGTTVGSANSSGITASAATDPFGRGTATGSQWAGGARDATGLIDRRVRTYNPELGIFISEDPSGTAGGVNLYAYAAGDPVNLTDALGLWPSWSDVGHAVTGAGSDPLGLGVSWSDVGHAAGALYNEAASHYGVAAAVITTGACIAASAGACGLLVVGGTAISSLLIETNPDLTGGQKALGLGLNAVITATGAIPAGALAAAGTRALRGMPNMARYGLNYLVGLPGTVASLLDPHVNASGGLASSLGDE